VPHEVNLQAPVFNEAGAFLLARTPSPLGSAPRPAACKRAGAWHNALLQAGPAPERAVMSIRILSQNPVG
jgi:hypothetical protein